MILSRFEVHKDVVNVDYYNPIHLLSNDGFYKGCEYQDCITKPEGHHQKLIRFIPCAVHCFFHILICNLNFVVLRL